MTLAATPPAIVLAGGLGTRLRAITRDRWPKPMVPVPTVGGPRPFLEWPLGWLRREGMREVVICIGHLGEQIVAHFGDGAAHGLAIRYDDAGAADTGARCRSAFAMLPGDLALVVCGDVFVEFRLAGFLDRLGASRARLALAREGGGAAPNAAFADGGTVTAFDRAGVAGAHVGVEAGVLAIRSAAFDGFDEGDGLSLVNHVYPREIAAGALSARLVAETFHDIGTPEGYARFCRFAATRPPEGDER